MTKPLSEQFGFLTYNNIEQAKEYHAGEDVVVLTDDYGYFAVVHRKDIHKALPLYRQVVQF